MITNDSNYLFIHPKVLSVSVCAALAVAFVVALLLQLKEYGFLEEIDGFRKSEQEEAAKEALVNRIQNLLWSDRMSFGPPLR